MYILRRRMKVEAREAPEVGKGEMAGVGAGGSDLAEEMILRAED